LNTYYVFKLIPTVTYFRKASNKVRKPYNVIESKQYLVS